MAPKSSLGELPPEQRELLRFTTSHFQEIARLNRFAENSSFEHEISRCLICHPELIPANPFAIYLEVVTESIKVRRPSLDQPLVDEINGDLAFQGVSERVTIESLAAGDRRSIPRWKDWLRDALSTGLGLLSVHSRTSHEFSLEEAEEQGWGESIEEKLAELMSFQKSNL